MEDNIYWSALFGDMRDTEAQERCKKYIKENEGKKDVFEAYILLAVGIVGQREQLKSKYAILLELAEKQRQYDLDELFKNINYGDLEKDAESN